MPAIFSKKYILVLFLGLFAVASFFLFTTQKAQAQESCQISSVRWDLAASGAVGEDFLGTVSQVIRPPVGVKVKTNNCNNVKLDLQLWSATRNSPVTDGSFNQHLQNILVDDNEEIFLRLQAGTNRCKQMGTQGEEDDTFDCRYYWKIFLDETGGGMYDGSRDSVDGFLEYECAPYWYRQTQNNLVPTPCTFNGGASPRVKWGFIQQLLPEAVVEEGSSIGLFGDGANCPEDNPMCLLAPLPGFDEVDESTTIGGFVNIYVRLIIGIVTLLAVIMIVVGGVQYMTTDALTGKQNARDTITNAVLGLLLALGSYVLLFTINPQLIKVEPYLPEATIAYDASNAILQPDGTFTEEEGGPPIQVCGANIVNGNSWAEHLASNCTGNYVRIRDILNPTDPRGDGKKIVVNAGECINIGDRECTSTWFEESVGNSLINALQSMLNNSAINTLRITGGSEVWLHKTHKPNVRVLDLGIELRDGVTAADVAALNQFLVGEAGFPGLCQRQEPAGSAAQNIIQEIIDESPNACSTPAHWHVIFD